MSENTMTSSRIEELVNTNLSKQFVNTEEISAAISIAIQSGKNVLLYGPAGFGKSEMINCLTEFLFAPKHCEDCKEDFVTASEETDSKASNGSPKSIKDKPFCEKPGCGEQRVFVQSFGEGMDETRLFGGVDFKRFDERREIVFNPENSFLNYECAVFEEIFDAPPVVLLSLKDTLTSKELRNGNQRFPMKTKVIFGLTNKSPEEISSLGPSAHALTERFPIQLEVRWEDYSKKAWKQLFDKVYPKKYTDIKKKLAALTEMAYAKGSFISPRTAIHALEACVVNSDRGLDECLKSVRFIAGYQGVYENMAEELREMEIREEAQTKIASAKTEFDFVQNLIMDSDNAALLDIETVGSIITRLKKLDGELESLVVPDDLWSEKSSLRYAVEERLNQAKSLLEELFEKAQPAALPSPDPSEYEDNIIEGEIEDTEDGVEIDLEDFYND